MLTFDIHQTPPTAEQIDQERDRVQGTLRGFKILAGGLFLTLLVVTAGLQLFLYLQGAMSGSKIVGLAGFVVVAFVGSVVVGGFVGGDFKMACAGGIGFIAVAVAYIFSGAVVYGAVGLSGFPADAIPIIALVIACILVLRGLWKLDEYKKHLTLLIPLPEANEARCPEILDLCRDKACEAYRLAAAIMDRPLVVAEANMMEAWVKDADNRRVKDACRLLQSKEPLTHTPGEQP